MSLNGVAGFAELARVPNEKLLVVSNRAKVGVVVGMPGHILNYRGVPLENGLGIKGRVCLLCLGNVPQADSTVISSAKEVPFLQGTPRKTIALFRVPLEANLWIALAIF